MSIEGFGMAEPFWALAFDITQRIVSVNKNSRFIRDRSPFLPLNDLLLRRLRARTSLFISHYDESCPADLIQTFIHSVLLVAAAPLDMRKGSAFPARQEMFSGLRPSVDIWAQPNRTRTTGRPKPSAHQAAQPRRSRQMTMTANNFG